VLIASNRKLSNYTSLFPALCCFGCHIRFEILIVIFKRRYFEEVIAINVRIILECILNWFRNMWTAFLWL
jgi:hypothetical protein